MKTANQETRKLATEVRKCSIYRFGLFESVFNFSLKANSDQIGFLLDIYSIFRSNKNTRKYTICGVLVVGNL